MAAKGAFRIKLDQRSLQNVLRNLERAGGEIKKRGEAALRAEAENIMTESKRQVPVDTGALRSTGHVEQPTRGGSRLSVILAYGGPAGAGGAVTPGYSKKTKRVAEDPVGYAVYVHEDLEAHHTVGKAKYLEDPVKAAIPGMTERLAAIMRD